MAGNQVTHIYHVSQFADVLGGLHALEQVFRLLKEKVQSFPCAMQTKVATHNAYIGRHYLVHLLHVLGNEHLFFVAQCALVIPLGYVVVELVCVHHLYRVLCRGIGIHYGLYQRVACQTVASVQSCARAFAHGIQASDTALSVKVHLDAAAHVVCTWRNGYVVLCYVYAQA